MFFFYIFEFQFRKNTERNNIIKRFYILITKIQPKVQVEEAIIVWLVVVNERFDEPTLNDVHFIFGIGLWGLITLITFLLDLAHSDCHSQFYSGKASISI